MKYLGISTSRFESVCISFKEEVPYPKQCDNNPDKYHECLRETL
ncbi:hypothetical protein SAMN05443661_12647 [Natronobacterium gregoryi]|uniref:Uncharacterized protein n=2 Tax=Natronobacterium gregoryi TaxID=44930 RepID=L0ACY7_NATGS|nr:hypothetical protein Natgr_0020 [Natronobacterium gregoryi SP2]SFJ39664.1 hypothetical protein SAMN05443661_12647 [Natronobacterium gregoryi]